MITVDRSKNVLTFVPDEELDQSPVIVVNIGLDQEATMLADDQQFLNSLDNILTHIYTTIDLWLDGNTNAVKRIESSRRKTYEITLEELLNTASVRDMASGVLSSEVNNIVHRLAHVE